MANQGRTLRRRTEGLVVRRAGDELVVLDLDSELVHNLNDTASLIWENVDELGSSERLARLLVERFEISADTALSDVRAIVEQMESVRLLVPARQDP